MSHAVPAEFQLVAAPEGFIGHNGPYYWRWDAAGRLEFGFQSDQRHNNPNGVVHGGAVLGFLDTILGHVVVRETGKRCATVALDSRFVAATPPGKWITGRVTARKVTRSLAFLDAEAMAGDTRLVTATAIFRVFDAAD
jgi:acyl-coenzyme A thioesterase PaaI-like protein